MKNILIITFLFLCVEYVSAQRANTSSILVGNDTTQVLTTGTDTLDWNSGSNGIIDSFYQTSTVEVHNLSDGKSGSILIIRDASITSTFDIEFFSDQGTTALDYLRIGEQTTIDTIAYGSTSVNFKRANNYVTTEFVHGDTISEPVPDNTIAVWELNGNTTTVVDEKVNSPGTRENGVLTEQATVTNLTYSNDFDGTDDYISIPHTSDINVDGYTDSYSFSVWINGSVKEDCRLIGKWNGTGSAPYPLSIRYLATFGGNGAIYMQLSDGSNQPFAKFDDEATSIIWDGNWHHAVGVVNNSTDSVYFYFDGELKDQQLNTAASATANTDDLSIGAGTEGGTLWFDGLIDQVRLIGEAITLADVEDIYNSGNGEEY